MGFAKQSMTKVTLPAICHPRHMYALLLPGAGSVFRERYDVGLFKKLFESLGLRESLVRQNILQSVMSVSQAEGHHFLAVHDGYAVHYILLHTSHVPPPKQNSTICPLW